MAMADAHFGDDEWELFTRGMTLLNLENEQRHGLSLQGSVVASDAFFPFRDGIDVLAEAGASCVIHPGGSMRDEEVIAAADEHGLAMVLTGVRHFRH